MKAKLLLSLILLIAVMISGCGSSEESEEVLRAKLEEEVRAELLEEQEAKEKEEETEIISDTETVSETEINEVDTEKVEAMTISIEDKEAVLDFLEEALTTDYDLELDKDTILTQDENFVYGDFTGDSDEDLVVMVNAWYLAYVTVADQAYELIDVVNYSPSYIMGNEITEGFSIVSTGGGGTGLGVYADHISVYDGNTMKEMTFLIEELNDAGDGIEYSAEGRGIIEGTLKSFDYSYEEINTISNKVLKSYTTHYEYDSSTYEYVETIIKDIANEEENTQVENEDIDSVGEDLTTSSDEIGYTISELKAGDFLGEMLVDIVDYTGDKVDLILIHEGPIEGSLFYSYDEMYEMDSYAFVPDQALLDEEITYTFNGGYEGTISLEYVNVIFENPLSEDEKAYLKDGKEVKISLNSGNYSYSAKEGSEGGGRFNIDSYEVLTEVGASNSEPIGETGLSFTDETIAGTFIDYEQYGLVVIPMNETVNKSLLTSETVDFEGSGLFQITFLGHCSDLKVNLVNSPGEEGQWMTVGDVENTIVNIKANLIGDMSTIYVYGTYKDAYGNEEDVEVTLDDMRDSSSYSVLTYFPVVRP